MKDLHLLPKIRDSWSYLYVEHCRIDQEDKAVAIHDATGKTPVPCAVLALLMLGPGTSITHAAIRTLAENGCLVMWCGEESVRFYAVGVGETRSARNFLAQARLWADPAARLAVVTRMYRMRFPEQLPPGITLEQLRGREGIRVRQAYAVAAKEHGVVWEGRDYKTSNWSAATPINRALSCANSCLYGLCHAAIVSAGFSTALGFIHTGKMLSFVYDIADLYKTETTIPTAFATVKADEGQLESRIRKACRDSFFENNLLERIIPDIFNILGTTESASEDDRSGTAPGQLWDGGAATAPGGFNYADALPEKKRPRSEAIQPSLPNTAKEST